MKRSFPLTDYALLITATLFLLASSASAATEKVVTAFNPALGTYPAAELVVDSAGNLYGTTPQGGKYGLGTAFELQAMSGGRWNRIVLHDFAGSADGKTPSGPLVFDNAGDLFGMTYQGGSGCNCGTVFELSQSEGKWQETVIYSFGGQNDGSFPAGGLVFDSSGNLYGTTSEGGSSAAAGTAFELTPGTGGWTETILHTFGLNYKDGSTPNCTLVFDASGNLYGTTTNGGAGHHGTAFELSPHKGGWQEQVIHTFWQGQPYSGVILDNSGNLYGTALIGGRNGFGYVFQLTLSGNSWTKTNIHQFSGSRDGSNPRARLLFVGGNLYGTATAGGAVGLGVLFELSPGKGTWQEKVLHAFAGGHDGANPYAGVTPDSSGNLYGTTTDGGRLGQGTAFEFIP
jgi:uncharacterized repeat protein (TIGR03803 family)